MINRQYTNPRTGELVDSPQILQFTDFLSTRRRTVKALSEALYDLGAAVRETGKKGKKGTLQLTITVEAASETAVTVTDAIKLNLPDAERDASIFYTDDQGNLSRTPPEEPKLPLYDASVSVTYPDTKAGGA